MSLALATKGIIAQFVTGGGSYPVYIYVPMEEPGIVSHGSTDTGVKSKVIGEPSIRPKGYVPRIKAEVGE